MVVDGGWHRKSTRCACNPAANEPCHSVEILNAFTEKKYVHSPRSRGVGSVNHLHKTPGPKSRPAARPAATIGVGLLSDGGAVEIRPLPATAGARAPAGRGHGRRPGARPARTRDRSRTRGYPDRPRRIGCQADRRGPAPRREAGPASRVAGPRARGERREMTRSRRRARSPRHLRRATPESSRPEVDDAHGRQRLQRRSSDPISSSAFAAVPGIVVKFTAIRRVLLLIDLTLSEVNRRSVGAAAGCASEDCCGRPAPKLYVVLHGGSTTGQEFEADREAKAERDAAAAAAAVHSHAPTPATVLEPTIKYLVEVKDAKVWWRQSGNPRARAVPVLDVNAVGRWRVEVTEFVGAAKISIAEVRRRHCCRRSRPSTRDAASAGGIGDCRRRSGARRPTDNCMATTSDGGYQIARGGS